jgi:hypothetical protein
MGVTANGDSGSDQLNGTAQAQFLAQVRHLVAGPAFRPERASAALALAALCGHAELELDFVKVRARTGSAGDGLVGDAVADANNHGRQCVEAAIDANDNGLQ